MVFNNILDAMGHTPVIRFKSHGAGRVCHSACKV